MNLISHTTASGRFDAGVIAAGAGMFGTHSLADVNEIAVLVGALTVALIGVLRLLRILLNLKAFMKGSMTE